LIRKNAKKFLHLQLILLPGCAVPSAAVVLQEKEHQP
jgi:hypothetical protein